MSVSPYPAYTGTEVPWIRRIPATWRIERAKRLFELRKVIAGRDDLPLLSVTQRGILPRDIRTHDGQLADDYSKYQMVDEGDFVMNAMDLLTGFVDQSPTQGITSPDYRVFRLRQDSPVTPEFLLLQLQSGYHNRHYYHLGQGASHFGRWRLPTKALLNLPFSVPPVAEQRAIVRYIRRQTAKIDALVGEQERLLALLQEKRQAVISNAVTKGLAPNMPMRDSGVPSIGEVPAHWGCEPLKHSWHVIDCKHVTPEFTDDGFPLASIREVQGRWVDLRAAKRTTAYFYRLLIEGDRRPAAGDLIFSRNATVGEVAQVAAEHPPFAMGQDVVLLRKKRESESSDYLQQVLRSPLVRSQLDQLMIGSTFKRINVEEVRSIVVPRPSPEEQRGVAQLVQAETNRADAILDEAEHAIRLLRERRTALITAAVTGQFDVRGIVDTAA